MSHLPFGSFASSPLRAALKGEEENDPKEATVRLDEITRTSLSLSPPPCGERV
jgi:hypothetical protein